jgi:Ni,Fe-hydrogenase III component G
MPSIYEQRPEKEQVALAYLAAEELLTPISGPFPQAPNPADEKVPSWGIDSLSFTHLVFPYAERRIKTVGTDRPDALDVSLTADQLLPAVAALIDGNWGYLASIVGVDLGVAAGEFEVLYIFCAGAAVLTLAVKIPRETAVIPSVCGIIPSASFFERELSEMFGITVQGTPNPDRLFLPDEWPAGVHPLRKDFEVPPFGGETT